MNRKIVSFFSPLLAASFLASVASATVILDETFSAGQRLTQNLPNTSAWYGATGSAGSGIINLTQSSAGMITLDTSANGQLITYFTDSGTVSLDVGETLKLSVGFQIAGAGNINNGVRMGVMDSSAGARVTADDQGTSHARFADYTGYGAWFNPNGGGTTGMNIRQRIPGTNGLLSSSGATVWPTMTSGGGTIVIADNTDYTAEIYISRAVDGVTLKFTLLGGGLGSGATISHNDLGSSVFAFDTFAIWVNGSAATSFSLTGAEITVIPEPSTYALAFGFVAAAFLVIHRRRTVAAPRA